MSTGIFIPIMIIVAIIAASVALLIWLHKRITHNQMREIRHEYKEQRLRVRAAKMMKTDFLDIE